MRRLSSSASAVFFVFALAACSHGPATVVAPVVLAAWTELGADTDFFARAVVEGSCPSLTADGALLAMSERAAPSEDFPRVCEVKLDRSVRSIALGTWSLPVLPAEPRHFAVVGDTGCRIKLGKKGVYTIQGCGDATQWPFAGVAGTVAAGKPDLVIHVGDYQYREVACPAGHPECAGSPFGENWASWRADFFTPATPLLAAAPWVFVRGNHESCDRSGAGWFRFFDPRPYRASCGKTTPPYRISLPGLDLALVDSAEIGSTEPALTSLAAQPVAEGKSAWLILHRPFLAPSAEEAKQTVKWPADLARHFSLVLAGHIHVFGASHFADSRPPEVITGNGGALLDKGPFPFEKNKKIRTAFNRDFGFLSIDRERPGRWSLVEHDVAGHAKVRCDLRERKRKGPQLHCVPADVSN